MSKTIKNGSLENYFGAVGKFALLKVEQERELSRRIKAGMQSKKTLETLGKTIKDEDKQELLSVINDGQEARNELVERNLRLVIYIAKSYGLSPGFSFEDLFAEGNLGLITAAEKFDGTRGCKFSTYAAWWIRLNINIFLENNRTIRIPRATIRQLGHYKRLKSKLTKKLEREVTDREVLKKMGYRTDKAINRARERILIAGNIISIQTEIKDRTYREDPLSPKEEEKEEKEKLLKEALEKALNELTPRERAVISLRFGLSDNGIKKTLNEVGFNWDISNERVRQIEKEVLEKLRANDQLCRLQHS